MDEKYMDFYTKAEINAMLNGLSFIKISKADFDTLAVKDSNTVYYVYNGDKITMYMGETNLSGGATAGNAIQYLINPALVGLAGNATVVPEE